MSSFPIWLCLLLPPLCSLTNPVRSPCQFSFYHAHQTIDHHVTGCADLYSDHFVKICVHSGIIYRRDYLREAVFSPKLLRGIRARILADCQLEIPIKADAVELAIRNYCEHQDVPVASVENQTCEKVVRTTKGHDVIVREMEFQVYDADTDDFIVYSLGRPPFRRTREEDIRLVKERQQRPPTNREYFPWWEAQNRGMKPMLNWTLDRISLLRPPVKPEQCVYYPIPVERSKTSPKMAVEKYKLWVEKNADNHAYIKIKTLRSQKWGFLQSDRPPLMVLPTEEKQYARAGNAGRPKRTAKHEAGKEEVIVIDSSSDEDSLAHGEEAVNADGEDDIKYESDDDKFAATWTNNSFDEYESDVDPVLAHRDQGEDLFRDQAEDLFLKEGEVDDGASYKSFEITPTIPPPKRKRMDTDRASPVVSLGSSAYPERNNRSRLGSRVLDVYNDASSPTKIGPSGHHGGGKTPTVDIDDVWDDCVLLPYSAHFGKKVQITTEMHQEADRIGYVAYLEDCGGRNFHASRSLCPRFIYQPIGYNFQDGLPMYSSVTDCTRALKWALVLTLSEQEWRRNWLTSLMEEGTEECLFKSVHHHDLFRITVQQGYLFLGPMVPDGEDYGGDSTFLVVSTDDET